MPTSATSGSSCATATSSNSTTLATSGGLGGGDVQTSVAGEWAGYTAESGTHTVRRKHERKN